MKEPDDEEDDNLPDRCPTCFGSGEVGPTGWEFPEWDTCPDCKGSGLERDHEDPDRAFEEAREK
jgi:DnaJ-class molecular chaperone